MKRLIWICGIYPDNDDPYLGDFIERHAKAVSQYTKIYLINVRSAEQDSDSERTINEKLSVRIVRRRRVVPAKIQRIRLLLLYLQLVRNYIAQYGKPDAVHVHYSIHVGWVGWMIRKMFRVQYFITEHYSGFLEESVTKKVRYFLKNAISVSAVSKHLALSLQRIDQRPVEVTPNIVDSSLFYYESDIKRKQVFTFLHNSGEENIKNSLFIVECARQLHRRFPQVDFRLHLFGPFREDISQYILDKRLQNRVVQFGMIPQSELASEMRRASCLIQHSTIETFGCIVAEALCCGLPVIVSDIPAMVEMVDETTGVLVELRNQVQLISAMHEMIQNLDRYRSADIAAAAAAKYAPSVIAKQFAHWYEQLLSN